MDLRAPTVRRLAFALATVAVVAVIIAWRKSDAIINPQLVAEDGAVFFVQAYERPPFHAWFLPYGGYLHLLPRIVADVALYFDAAAIPHIYAYAALALNLWVAVVLCSPRLELGFLTRTALALAYALVPHTGEVFVSLTNVQWTLAPVLVILVLLRDASTPGERVRDFLSIGVIGLTGPFIVFLLPLFIGRLVARRSRESVFLAAVATVVALVQLSFLLRDQAAFARSTPIDLGLLLPVLSARTFGTMWGGYGLYSISSSAYWLALGIVGVGVLATLALVPGRWREYRTVIGAAFILFSLPVAAKFLREAIVLTAPHNGDRYFFRRISPSPGCWCWRPFPWCVGFGQAPRWRLWRWS